MYIINMNNFPANKVFQCKGLLANWLMTEKNIPLLGTSEDGKFCFSKTDLLDEILKTVPFWYRVGENFR